MFGAAPFAAFILTTNGSGANRHPGARGDAILGLAVAERSVGDDPVRLTPASDAWRPH
jgi:hypothetical protein